MVRDGGCGEGRMKCGEGRGWWEGRMGCGEGGRVGVVRGGWDMVRGERWGVVSGGWGVMRCGWMQYMSKALRWMLTSSSIGNRTMCREG